MSYHKNSPKLVFRNLGQFTSNEAKKKKKSLLGLYLIYGTKKERANTILVDPRQGERSLLNTGIHEMVHHLCPEWSESKVTKAANKLSNIVWQMGFRKQF